MYILFTHILSCIASTSDSFYLTLFHYVYRCVAAYVAVVATAENIAFYLGITCEDDGGVAGDGTGITASEDVASALLEYVSYQCANRGAAIQGQRDVTTDSA